MSLKELRALLEKNGASKEMMQEILSMLSQTQHGIDQSKTYIGSTSQLQTNWSNEAVDIVPPQFQKEYEHRYRTIKSLGRGGMGEVFQVFDHVLRRKVAMKTIHHELIHHLSVRSRFIDEAQVIAQLQHPNIIPIYDFGENLDGDLYYTMIEVEGFRLDQLIDAVHHEIQNQTWVKTSQGWTFHRLISVFLNICEAIAFAHENGVLHRDLKPENVMIGSYGAVFVMDWGISKVIGREESTAVETERSQKGGYQTRFGDITGTPAYMSPEQARGENKDLDERSDIYALGAILHEILFGIPPYTGANIIQQIHHKKQTPLDQYISSSPYDGQNKVRLSALPPLPKKLIEACQTALSFSPDSRFTSASALALLIREWLDGSQKREQALSIVEQALNKEAEIERLQKYAQHLREEAQQQIDLVQSWEPEEKKEASWNKEDHATLLLEEAELMDIQREQLLQAALTHKSDLQEAHLALVQYYRSKHEQQSGRIEQQKIELRLRKHALELPKQHTERNKVFDYLKGQGTITLDSYPSGAEVWIQPYETKNRRMVLGEKVLFGHTPIHKKAIEMGSYRCTLSKKGFEDVLYPVSISRKEHWDGMKHETLIPIWLPPKNALPPGVCYIPAGWYWSGGDPELATSLPKRRLWLDAFCIQRFPVSQKEYILFLNHLMKNGQEEVAKQCAPKERDAQSFLINIKNGIFTASTKERIPIHSIDWFAAQQYSSWLSQTTSKSWRLPYEMEWEKSAKGVDGRFFPWGNDSDPSWACMRDSHLGVRTVAPLNTYPIDESPYGIRGMGGNVMDWTQSVYRKSGPEVRRGYVLEEDNMVQPDSEMVYKGGCWYFGSRFMRIADRHAISAQHRGNLIGFRMVYDLTEQSFSSTSKSRRGNLSDS